MGLKPDYRILADGVDTTALIMRRLVSLRYTDEAGMESDVLEIVLADNDPENPIQVPPTGAELDLSIGYDGVLDRVGVFVCDEVNLAGPPGEMTIRGRAAAFDASKGGIAAMQSQKCRSWEKGLALASLVKKIASEHSLEAAVSDILGGIVLPHLDQTDESDLHFLSRLAKRYDAVVKPAVGKLIMAKIGMAKSVSGENIPAVTLTPKDVSRFRVTICRREVVGMVVAYYHEKRTAKRHEVKVGDGAPVTRLKSWFPTQEMALAAARSEWDRRSRRAITLSLTAIGRTDLMAEGRVVLVDFRDGVDGEYSITRAEHSIDGGGYSTSIEAESPLPEGEAVEVEDAVG